MSYQSVPAAFRQLLQQWSRAGVSHIPHGAGEWLRTLEHQIEVSVDAAPGTPATTIENTSISIEHPHDARSNQPLEPQRELNVVFSPCNTWAGPPLAVAERTIRFEVLSQQVATCTRCNELSCTRKKTVFGTGNLTPRVVFFGEAPGADEDREGKPFVGRAGQLLDKIIVAIKMQREDVYILNAIKCRPPGNRVPTESEVENCREYFETQLETLRPDFIVCLGATAVRAILKSTASVGSLRGKWHEYKGSQVLVTYHPAYLLRNEDAKKLTWADMQMLMRRMGTLPPTS